MKMGMRSVARAVALVALTVICIWGVAGAALAVLVVASHGDTAVLAADGDLAVNAPEISGVTAVSITANGATIIWETDELAGSRVEYGETTDYGSTATAIGYVTSHSVDLQGLSPLTNYHYKVISAGFFFSGTSESEDGMFTTQEGDDDNAPVISGVTVTNITATDATITWTTDEDADSQVEFGPTTTYGLSTTLNATLTMSHSVVLTGLLSETKYYYRVNSKDAAGNLSQVGGDPFTTLDSIPPLISSVAATNITTTSADITWTTNEKADGLAEYGLTAYYGLKTNPDTKMVTTHRVALTGLSQRTTYHFRVISKDAVGNERISGDCEFVTLDDTPPVISTVITTDLTSTSATIKWETDERTDSQVEYGLTANYGSRTAVDPGWLLNHSVILTGLKSQTTYHYRVKSTDGWGNSTRSPDATFTTTDINAPVISRVTATNITDTSATITWVTDSAAESQLEYGTKAGYGLIATYDNTLVTSHSIALSGLTAQTVYHYKVKSRDASGLWAESADYTFNTGGGTGNTSGETGADAPKIFYLAASQITSSGATVSWSTHEPATAQVEYGLTEEYGSLTVLDTRMATSHSAPLPGLKSGATYHYRVISKDAAGNQTVSADQTFHTPIGEAPLPSLPNWAWVAVGITGALAVGVLVVRNR